MGKKKSSGIKYNSEEEAYNDLQRLIEAWKKNKKGTRYNRGSYLKLLKKEYRSTRILRIVFSNPVIFDIVKESQYIPYDLISEDDLIKLVYDTPKVLCPNDYSHPYIKKTSIPENKQTLPVMVAFELGKRRTEYISNKIFCGSGEKLYYCPKAINDKERICDIADNVTKRIGFTNLNDSTFFETEEKKDTFFDNLIATIRKEMELINCDNKEAKENQILPITPRHFAVAALDRHTNQSKINEIIKKLGNREIVPNNNDITNPQGVDRQ